MLESFSKKVPYYSPFYYDFQESLQIFSSVYTFKRYLRGIFYHPIKSKEKNNNEKKYELVAKATLFEKGKCYQIKAHYRRSPRNFYRRSPR